LSSNPRSPGARGSTEVPVGGIKSLSFAGLPGTHPTNMPFPPDLGNASFRSASSLASVFADDIKMRQSGANMGSLRSKSGSRRRETTVEEQNRRNEMLPVYSQIDKREEKHHRHHHRDRGDSVSEFGGSQMSINSQINQDARVIPSRGGEHTHKWQKSTKNGVNEENALNNEKSWHMRDNNQPGGKGRSDSRPPVPSNGLSGKGKHVSPVEGIYANISSRNERSLSRNGEDETTEERRLRRERTRKEKTLASGGLGGSPELSSRDFKENEGVTVHTVPGKPSTIEVSYSGGPITISVDTAGNDFDNEEEEENEDSSYEDDEQVTSVKGNQKKNRKPEEPLYYNQSELQDQLRLKQEKRARAEKAAKVQQEREEKLQAEMERQIRKQEEDEKQARKEEREKRRAKKQQRRKDRQDQYQEEFVDVPTEELATERPLYILDLPDELKDEESFDSDGFEQDLKLKQNVSKQKAFAVADEIRKRWSQDELEDDDYGKGGGSRERQGSDSSSKGNKKPPRPVAVPFNLNSGDVNQHSTENSTGNSDIYQNVSEAREADRLKRPPPEAAVRSSRRSVESLSESKPNQPFVTEMKEISSLQIERVTVSNVKPHVEAESKPKTGNNAPFDNNLQDNNGAVANKFVLSQYEIRHGLNMRVTGEVPKALTKNEHSSARTAFMLATPVGIESSSEASESEFGSTSSLTGTKKMIGGYTKPYKSFGKIETNTQALEDALAEYQHGSSGDQSSGEMSIESSVVVNGRRSRQKLSSFSANASTDVKAEFDSPIASRRTKPVQNGGNVDSSFTTIHHNTTKLSKQFAITDEHIRTGMLTYRC